LTFKQNKSSKNGHGRNGRISIIRNSGPAFIAAANHGASVQSLKQSISASLPAAAGGGGSWERGAKELV